MREIRASEARNRFGRLLALVTEGEEFVITRRGKVIARLLPNVSRFERAEAEEAITRIVARRTGVTLDGLAIEELVRDGRA